MSNNHKERRGPMGGPGGHGMGAVEKAKDFKGTIKKIISYIGKYKLAVIVVMIFAISSTVFNIVGPKILGKATNEIFTGLVSKVQGTGSINFEKIGLILLILLGIYALGALFNFIQSWVMTGISQKIAFRMRKEISEKINRMPLKYFESRTVGEVLSRITNDVDTLGMSLNQSITTLITSIATIIGVLVMMLTISPLMTLIILIILPISAILIGLIMKKSQKYFTDQQEYLGQVNGQVEEVYSGHNIVKVFNREKASVEEFDVTNDKLYKSAWKSQFISGLMQPIMMFVGNLGYVVVAILGGILAVKGTITVGDIQAFFQYVRNFTQPISQIAQVSNMLQSMAAAAERVFEFLEEDEEDQKAITPATITDVKLIDGKEVKETRNVNSEDLKGSVTFDHVKFGYDPEKIIINDFSAKITPGQMVAIVGPTGAGKTTMVKLLMRFYDVNSGAILLDDYNIKNFDRVELREEFSMVLQDTWLFKGTIMENIRYGKLDATDDEVISAAKSAHAHHFVSILSDGYNTVLAEDASNISGGQRQLLTIARAILADKPILILDEATSSVDTRTEGRIQRAMNNLMKGRTSFVIAHRLSTIKDADLILVMKDGDIIEQGTHNELIAKKGFYENLYNSQFEDAAE